MAKKWKDLYAKMSPAARAEVDARVRASVQEMPLQELRKARELTQATLADAMNVSQSEISKLEQRADTYVSTLRSYVEAMGGTLEITARFPDGAAVHINQFRELTTAAPR